MITKEDFIDKAMDCRPSEREWRAMVDRALAAGAIDLQNAPDNYEAVYPLVGAILEKMAQWPINGSLNQTTRRRMRRMANRLRRVI